MAEKPVMHGRDHRPGGTDPIPGLGGSGQGVVTGAFVVGHSGTVTAGTIQTLTWSTLQVDTTGTFTGGGSNQTSWSIASTGIYLVTFTMMPSTAWPTAAQGTIDFLYDDPSGVFGYGFWTTYTPGSSNRGSFGAVVTTYTGVPTTYYIKVQNNSSVDFPYLGENFQTGVVMARIGPEDAIT